MTFLRNRLSSSETRSYGNSFNNLFDQNEPVLSNATIVLIIAYMRTGSTLTGSLFEAHSGTFYAFEPLFGVENAFRRAQAQNQSRLEIKFAAGLR